MDGFGPPAAFSKSVIPPQVAAAQEYLRYAEQLRNPPRPFDGQAGEARELNSKEQAVYDAALEVLRLYFSGEKDYAPALAAPSSPSDDEPRERVPTGF